MVDTNPNADTLATLTSRCDTDDADLPLRLVQVNGPQTTMDAQSRTQITVGGTLLAIGIPSGLTSGEVTQTASDLVTGSGCHSPQASSETKAVTGAAPSDSLIINVKVDNPSRLQGSTTVHILGTPPRDYSVSYDLAR